MKLVQTGTYNSRNKGDAAMQVSMAQSLSRVFPSADLVISSPFAEMDEPLYREWRVVHCYRRQLIFATFQLIRAGIWGVAERLFKKDWRWLTPEPETRAYAESDLVIDLSGDMLTEDYGVHVAYSHYIPLILALLMNRRLVVSAQSIGPFKWTRPLIRYLLNKAVYLSVRDKISFDYLQSIGIRNPTLELTADMAFLLEPVDADRAQALLQTERYQPEPGLTLGVSLSNLVERKFGAKNPNGATMSFIDLFASALNDVAARHGLKLLFVPHVTGPAASKDDRLVAARVAERLSVPHHVITGDYTPSEIKGIVGQCDLMLGARMHANIAALSSGIPTVAIAYSHKTPGIMGQLGLDGRVLDIASLDREAVVAAVDKLVADRAAVREQLAEGIQRMRRSAMRNVEAIQGLLSSRPSMTTRETPSD